MKNKKTILIVLGIGVLLYLWSKGYFKSKRTPVGVPEPVLDATVEESKYFDAGAATTSMSPVINNSEPIHPLSEETVELTTYDENSGEVFNETVLASGRGFGHVRRMR